MVLAKTLGTSYDRPASLDAPRAPRKSSRTNFEMFAWIFMRFSGLALIILDALRGGLTVHEERDPS